MIRTILRLLLAGAALLAAAAATAGAQSPVSSEDFRLVTSDVTIQGARGAVVGSHSCRWTQPGPEDLPCLRFAGDPQAAIEEIKAAGGRSATIRVTSPDIALDVTSTITRRDDGSWLFSGSGRKSSRVCSADGSRCSFVGKTSRKASGKARR